MGFGFQRHPRKGWSENGFTLIELLFATFILAIVISTVYGSYRATFHIIDRAEAQLDTIHSARTVIERLSTDLKSIVTGQGGLLLGETQTLGGERGDSISFVSASHLLLSKKESLRGRAIIRYYAEVDDQTALLNIFRSDTLVYPGADVLQSPASGDIIGEGVAAFSISYLAPDGGESDEWNSAENKQGEEKATGEEELNLPMLVEIELRYGVAQEKENQAVFKTAVALPSTERPKS